MIVTDLQHATEQIAMTPSIEKAIDFLRHGLWQDLPEGKLETPGDNVGETGTASERKERYLKSLEKGRFEIDGNKVWGLVQTYQTDASWPRRMEAHRRHIDIHFIVSGIETIGWLPAEHLLPDEPYDQVRDVWWGAVPEEHLEEVSLLRLRAGQLALFFPDDGHLPRRAGDLPARVKKVLLKVAIQT